MILYVNVNADLVFCKKKKKKESRNAQNTTVLNYCPMKLHMVTHACYPALERGRLQGSEVPGQLELHGRPCLK